MKLFLINISLVLILSSVKAQQWVAFSQQSHYNLFLNDAYSGIDNKLNATLAHRSQYTFLTKTALASQYGSFSLPIISKKFGLGLKIVNDFIGYQRYTLGELTGAYHIEVGKSKLSFGLGIGLVNLNINGKLLRASGGNYENELVIHNDEFISNINVGGTAPSFSFGMLYRIADFEIGAAMQNINLPNLSLLKFNTKTKVIIDRTINVHAKYVIKTTSVNIEPIVLFNTDFIKHQMQLGINAEMRNIFFGLSFRGYSGQNNDALIGEFGVKIKKRFRIGYSYDYNVSALNKSNFGSHEISLNYMVIRKFSTKRKGNVLYNPRFL